MKTTYSTRTNAYSGKETSSGIQRLLAMNSWLCGTAGNARERRVSDHGDGATNCEAHRSLAGFTVASILAICLLPVGLHAQAPVFLGGQSIPYYGGDPLGVAVDGAGDLFVLESEDSLVLKVPAGGGAPTIVYDNLNGPGGIAVDSEGDIFIADTGNKQVVKIMAGTSEPQFIGSGFSSPVGIAVDTAGNVFVADEGKQSVVEFGADGKHKATFGAFYAPIAVAVDRLGNLYVVDQVAANQTGIWRVSEATNGLANFTDLIGSTGIAVDAANNIYIDDTYAGVVEITADSGSQITILNPNSLDQPFGLAVDGTGKLFVAEYGGHSVFELQTKSVDFGSASVCPAGDASTACSQIVTLNFTQNSSGGFYESTPTTQGTAGLDFKVSPGPGCVASATGWSCSANITFAPTAVGVREGSVQVSDSAGHVTTVYLRGIGTAPKLAFTPSAQTTVGSGLKNPAGVATDSVGNVYIADAANKRVVKVPAGGGAQTTVGTGLTSPEAVAVDGAGNVIIVDTGSAQVFKVSTAGVQTTVKSNLSSLTGPDGVAVDGEGNLFISDSFEGVVEVPADGSALTSVVNTGKLGVEGVAVDGAGNVFVTDTGNNRLLKVPAGGGSPTTVATTELKAPNGVAVDAAGNLFVLDGGNDRVVEVPSGGGAQFTIASGLNAPDGIFVDAAGDVFIGDSENNRVLKLARALPPALNFGFTAPATTANGSPQTVIVENIGNMPLTLTDVNYPKDFPIDFDENGSEGLCIGSISMAPGTLCDLAIEFTPLSVANFNEAVTLSYRWEDLIVPAMLSVPVSGSSLKQQTIAFNPPASVTYGAAAVNLAGDVSDSAGLPVALSVASGPAKISGTVVTFTGAGTVVIKASQAGNSSYAAVSVEKTIPVNKAVLTVTATNASVAYGEAIPALKFVVTGFMNGDPSSVVSGAPVETTTAKVGSPVAVYPIAIALGTLKASNYSFAFKGGTLTVTSLGMTAAPVFSVAGGTYTSAVSLTITDKTPGATVYYTLNGAVPTASSTKYTGPIKVAATETVKAIAVAPGYTNGAVASATYTIQ